MDGFHKSLALAKLRCVMHEGLIFKSLGAGNRNS